MAPPRYPLLVAAAAGLMIGAGTAAAQVTISPDTVTLATWTSRKSVWLDVRVVNPRDVPIVRVCLLPQIGPLSAELSGSAAYWLVPYVRDCGFAWNRRASGLGDPAIVGQVRFGFDLRPGTTHFRSRIVWADRATQEWPDSSGHSAGPQLVVRPAPLNRNAVLLAVGAAALLFASGIVSMRRRARQAEGAT